MASVNSPPSASNIDELDGEHSSILVNAIGNILATDAAETTFAQILDGLPTQEVARDGFYYMHDHPLFAPGHRSICDGFLDKAREFRARFHPSALRFEPQLLQAFQQTASGSKECNLRLVELVVIACHQIAAYLYELDDGAHKHEVHQAWLDMVSRESEEERHYIPPPSAFVHRRYQSFDRYPRGVADVAGYWAEGRIFGGVFWFERGETERECNGVWIHGARLSDPYTLYPPTEAQLDALFSFLLSTSDERPPCPLPINGTPQNRPRWDPYEAQSKFHIFRDKDLMSPPIQPPSGWCATSSSRARALDWPEVGDQMIWVYQNSLKSFGEPYDAEMMAAAEAGMQLFTPSSPFARKFK